MNEDFEPYHLPHMAAAFKQPEAAHAASEFEDEAHEEMEAGFEMFGYMIFAVVGFACVAMVASIFAG
jgi:hypothetical protein